MWKKEGEEGAATRRSHRLHALAEKRNKKKDKEKMSKKGNEKKKDEEKRKDEKDEKEMNEKEIKKIEKEKELTQAKRDIGGLNRGQEVMDLRSNQTIDRKRSEARAERELAQRKRQEAQRAREDARRKQREEEAMDRKAQKAQEHSEELRRGREQAIVRIEGYHRHIDKCTAEMRECERKVSELRERVKRQQATIRGGRAQAGALRCDADQLRREADSLCLQGAASRQLHGDRGRHGNQGHRHLLERANDNQREAMRREQDAEDNERNATEGEMNVGQLCDLLPAQGRERDVVQQDRRLEERRVAEMAEKLATYKREVANCET